MSLLFPENLPHVSSLDELRANDAVSIWPCIDPSNFMRPHIKSLGELTTNTNCDHEFMQIRQYQGNGWAIVRVPDATIRNEIVFDRKGNMLAALPWWRLGVQAGFFKRGDGTEIQQRLEKFISERPALPVCEITQPCTLSFQESHGHWLYETLLPLAVWKKIGFLPHLLSLDPCPDYRKQFLDLLDIPNNMRIFASRKENDFHCKELFLIVPWHDTGAEMPVLSSGWTTDRRHCYFQENGFWAGTGRLTMDFTQAIGLKANPGLASAERIFIGRKNTGLHRACLNEDEAFKIAQKYGFVYVNPATLTAEEEAATFYNAKVICGGCGGGINNAVFSRAGTRVICYVGDEDLTWPLPAVAAVNQLDLTIIRCTTFTSMERSFTGTLSAYALDLVQLNELLATL